MYATYHVLYLPLNNTTKNPKRRFLMSQSRFYFKININPKSLRDEHLRDLDLQRKAASFFLKNTLVT